MNHNRPGSTREECSFDPFLTHRSEADPCPFLGLQHAALFDAIDVGVFVLDLDGSLREANAAMARILGFASPRDLIASAAYLEEGVQLIQALRRGGVVREFEYRLQRHDSSSVWVSVSATLDELEQGRRQVFAILSKIEARKRREEALRRSETQYRKIVEMSPDAVCLTRFDGEFLAVNARFGEMFGYKGIDELRELGINSKDLVLESDDPKVQASGDALQANVPYTILTARVRRKDGSEFLAEFSASLIHDDDGKPEAFLTLIRDISARKRVEKALQQSEAWLRESQRIALLGHFVMDLSTGEWTGSESLESIFGIDAAFDRTLGSWLQIVHEEDRASFSADLERHVFETGDSFDREYRIVRVSDGQCRWVHGLGQLLPDEEERAVRFFGTIQDITESKAAEEARVQLEEQLWRSQKLEALGLLAGGIAHDLSNMLIPVLGNAEWLLRKGVLSDPDRRCLEDIREAGRRAHDLIRQLMAFGRKQTLCMGVFDLNEMVTEFLGLLSRALRPHIQTKFLLHPLPLPVRADRGQIEQVMTNLVLNAQDAMPQGGLLTISTAIAESEPQPDPIASSLPSVFSKPHGCLTVCDTGMGIPEQLRERVFEPFFTSKGEGRGTGLGLASAYGITRQHGGDIRMESEEGNGATFVVHLPLALPVDPA